MAMQNCRNCGHAEWSRSKSGAKLYGNWATCTARVDVTKVLPASLLTGISGMTVRELGKGDRGVASNQAQPMACPFWKPEEKRP